MGQTIIGRRSSRVGGFLDDNNVGVRRHGSSPRCPGSWFTRHFCGGRRSAPFRAEHRPRRGDVGATGARVPPIRSCRGNDAADPDSGDLIFWNAALAWNDRVPLPNMSPCVSMRPGRSGARREPAGSDFVDVPWADLKRIVLFGTACPVWATASTSAWSCVRGSVRRCVRNQAQALSSCARTGGPAEASRHIAGSAFDVASRSLPGAQVYGRMCPWFNVGRHGRAGRSITFRPASWASSATWVRLSGRAW